MDDDEDLRRRVKALENELENLKTRVEKLERALEKEKEEGETQESSTPEPDVPRPRDSLTDEWAEDVREGIPESVIREPYEGGGRYPRRGWRDMKLNIPPVARWIRFTVAVAVAAAAVILFQLAARRIIGEMEAAGLALGLGFAMIVTAEIWGRRLLQVELLLKAMGFVGGFTALVIPNTMDPPPAWMPEPALYTLTALALLMGSAFLFALKDGYATLACEAVVMGYAGALITMDQPHAALAVAGATTLAAGGFIYLRRWRAVAYAALVGSAYSYVRADAAEFEIQLIYLAGSFVVYSLVALSLSNVDSRRLHTLLVDVLDSVFLLVNAVAYTYFVAPLVMENTGGAVASAAVASAAAVYAALYLMGSSSRALTRSTPYLALALVAAAAVYGLPGDVAAVAAATVAAGVYIGTRSTEERDWRLAATLLHWFAAGAAVAATLEFTRPPAVDVVGPAAALTLAAAGLVGVLADDSDAAFYLESRRLRRVQAYTAAYLLVSASWLVFDDVVVTAGWAAAAAAFVAVGGYRDADEVVEAGHIAAGAAFLKLLVFDSRAVDAGLGLAPDDWLLGALAVAALLYLSYVAGVSFDVFDMEARYRWGYPLAGGVAFAAAAALELPGVASTALWTVFAAAMLASGLWSRREELLVVAVSMAAAAAAKLVLFDSVGLPSAVRAVLAVAVAASAVAGVFVYLRYKREILDLLRWNERS